MVAAPPHTFHAPVGRREAGWEGLEWARVRGRRAWWGSGRVVGLGMWEGRRAGGNWEGRRAGGVDGVKETG